jgi:hypothetical protein
MSAGPSKTVKVSDLNDIFARMPKLGDDTVAFERDIADAQFVLVPDRDPWGD